MWKKLIPRWLRPVRLKPGAAGVIIPLAISAGTMTTPSLVWVFWLSWVATFGFIACNTTVHGRHLWERFWEGPLYPRIGASLMDYPYVKDTVINGIKWEPGYSHVHLAITNQTPEAMGDLNLLLFLDKPIIRSACRSPFADCAIGVATRIVGQMTIMGTDKDGNEIAITGDMDNRIELGPPHRLVCSKLPSGAEIEIDLATVLPLAPPALTMWDHTKRDPTWIGIDGRLSIRGEEYPLMWRQFIGKGTQ